MSVEILPMPMLEKFYKLKIEEIRLRYENVSSTIDHNGEKGIENELILIDFLKEFLPQSYSIGRGFIIDSDGKTSRQCDIVIYDNFYNPNLIKFASNTYFPIESVYCVIEVKTIIRKRDINKASQDAVKISGLTFHEEDINFQNQGAMVFGKTRRPNYFLFGYKTYTNNANTLFNVLKKSTVNACFILNQGIFDKGVRELKPKFFIDNVRDLEKKLSGGQKAKLKKTTDKFFDFDGHRYPVFRANGTVYLANYVNIFLQILFYINHAVKNMHVGRDYLKHYFTLGPVLTLEEKSR